MKSFGSVNEALDFAIGEEEAAENFYRKLSETVSRPWMKRVLLEFALEEKGHRDRLLAIKAGTVSPSGFGKVIDLKIADYVVEVVPTKEMDYQDAIIVAMRKEKAAYKLYSDLASVTDDETIRKIFLGLAHDEANHKLRFEVEYDETVMKEN